MTTAHDLNPASHSLSDLFARFLSRRMQHPSTQLVPVSEVEPFDATVGGPPGNAVQAWDDATAVLTWLSPHRARPVMPHVWASLLTHVPTVHALPLAVGSIPQAVRDWHALCQASQLKFLQPAPAAVTEPLGSWTDGVESLGRQIDPVSGRLLAAGLLRQAGYFERAAVLLDEFPGDGPDAAVIANERAALAWMRGDGEQAARLWAEQEPSWPVQFNQGLADLFRGFPASARLSFASVSAALPESSGWHHLARLYQVLAEMHR